jgi:hypothetical protein
MFLKEVIPAFLGELRLLKISNLGLYIGIEVEVFHLVEKGHFLNGCLDSLDRGGVVGRLGDNVLFDIRVAKVFVERSVGLLEQVI